MILYIKTLNCAEFHCTTENSGIYASYIMSNEYILMYTFWIGILYFVTESVNLNDQSMNDTHKAKLIATKSQYLNL